MLMFSIVVPIYKVEKYIKQCIDSVLCQTYKHFELLLVDDGSPDNCPEICDAYAKNDTRIRVIHKQNGGLSSARNAGLDRASGEYIIFLDSDDYWDDKFALEGLKSIIEKNKCDVYITGFKKKYGDNILEYNDKSIISTDISLNDHDKYIKYLMQNNFFRASAWDKIYRREFIEKNGIRFTEGQLSEDIEWSAKILLCMNSIYLTNKKFYVYRRDNKGSISSNIGRKNMEDIYCVINKYSLVCENNVVALRNYLAQQYVLWMTNANRVKKNEIADLLEKAKKLWYLIDYDWYPYVKKVHMIKWMGFSTVIKLLGIYKKLINMMIL